MRPSARAGPLFTALCLLGVAIAIFGSISAVSGPCIASPEPNSPPPSDPTKRPEDRSGDA